MVVVMAGMCLVLKMNISPFPPPPTLHSKAEQQVHIWIDYMEHISRNLDRQSKLPRLKILHYEQLVADPSSILQQLEELFSLDFNDAMRTSVLEEWSEIMKKPAERVGGVDVCAMREEIETAVRTRCEKSKACTFAGYNKYT